MKDFELDTYLSQNLRIKKWEYGEPNYFLIRDHDGGWIRYCEVSCESQFVYFENMDFEVLDTLAEKGITMRELREAYKKLGWL